MQIEKKRKIVYVTTDWYRIKTTFSVCEPCLKTHEF